MGWSTLLRWLAPILPGASTPWRSARVARDLLTAAAPWDGVFYDYRGRRGGVSALARDAAFAREVLAQTQALLQPRWPLPDATLADAM